MVQWFQSFFLLAVLALGIPPGAFASYSLPTVPKNAYSEHSDTAKVGLDLSGIRNGQLGHDPLGEQGRVNLTAFCEGDPVNQVDPLGLEGGNVISAYGFSGLEDSIYRNDFSYALLVTSEWDHQKPVFKEAVKIGLLLWAGAYAAEAATEFSLFRRFIPKTPAAGPTIKAAKSTTAIKPYYPPNQGFLSETSREFMYAGQRIDRYGGSASSRFFSPAGTPAAARSLPSGTASQPLRSFEVVKPFEVESGAVAPYFGEIGYGTQYRVPVKLGSLLDRGILREVTP